MRRDELTALIRTHQAELYRYLRYLGADRTSAEDLVQETFLAAFQSDVNLEPGASAAAAWLRGIARNLFLQWCRRNRTSPARVDSETVERAEAAWRSTFLRGGDSPPGRSPAPSSRVRAPQTTARDASAGFIPLLNAPPLQRRVPGPR